MYRRKRRRRRRFILVVILILLIVLIAVGVSRRRSGTSDAVSASHYRAQGSTYPVGEDGARYGNEEVSVGEETILSDEDVIYGAIDEESDPTETDAAGLPDTAEEPYAYQTLTDEEKTVYREIVTAFTERAEEMTVSTLDTDVLQRAYVAVRYDHCEFFWVEQFGYVSYTRGDQVVSVAVRPHYAMTAEDQAQLQLRIDEEADRMLADAPVDGSDFDKALYVYETLIREVDYDLNASYGQTILSAFLEHATVCQGYSYATQYLLERLDIPCTTIPGIANGESHAWNLVYLDGDYYYMDTTWGNSKYVSRYGEGDEDTLPYKYVDYDYFGMTTEMLLTDHQPDGDIPLPLCEATADNYYVHEGLYVDTWDPDRIGGILRQGYLDGKGMVRIRFSDTAVYEEAMQYFLYDGNLFRWCEGLRTVNYLEDSANSVMVVIFPT